MNFNSLEFLIFLPLVVGIYWLTPHKFRWIPLLIASYYFYMSWNVQLVWLIFGTTLVSYVAARLVDWKPAYKKMWLVITLVVCLGVLAYFKYFTFFVNSALSLWNRLMEKNFRLDLDILLPVGISFYTFQTLSYVIDVYRGDIPAEKHFGYYALFVSYFPQLVAGPIESAGNLLPQLRKEHTPCWEDVRMGMSQLLSGFFRKCVVADMCGVYVNRVFALGDSAGSLAIFFGGALFCVQMYCDFAGYSEIALGAARLMGVKLMRNFDRPYTSLSYGEFFRRWHISLNLWFTSYLYIPLGGSRCGRIRRIVNTIIVFGLCGLWHGASWNYVLWGLYAALFVSLEGVFLKPTLKALQARGVQTETGGVRLLRQCIMFIIYIPAALLFRAGSVEQAVTLVGGLFTRWGHIADTFTLLQMSGWDVLWVVLSLWAMCLLDPLTREKEERGEIPLSTYVYGILLVLCCWIGLLATQGNAAFAYFQF